MFRTVHKRCSHGPNAEKACSQCMCALLISRATLGTDNAEHHSTGRRTAHHCLVTGSLPIRAESASKSSPMYSNCNAQTGDTTEARSTMRRKREQQHQDWRMWRFSLHERRARLPGGRWCSSGCCCKASYGDHDTGTCIKGYLGQAGQPRQCIPLVYSGSSSDGRR